MSTKEIFFHNPENPVKKPNSWFGRTGEKDLFCFAMQAPKFHSTNRRSSRVSFRDALLRGLAPDGGLYMPDVIPEKDPKKVRTQSDLGYEHLAAHILESFITDISSNDLHRICMDAYDFEVPLEQAGESTRILRLDRGPTASFKDFAARMMARLMEHYLSEEKQQIHILVATSGDTGSAIAHAFHGMPSIQVTVLFPEKEVSELQRKQMTTLGDNVRILALRGKFDDCQALVKKAFLDPDLAHLKLSSANSINIGRLLPQSIYYWHAWCQLCKPDESIQFAVPSGNFGNLTGGWLAKQMGLPVARFIVGTNENDAFPEFTETGQYHPIIPSRNCLSSAMNVGHPSNLPRLIEQFGGQMDETGKLLEKPNLEEMRLLFRSTAVTDTTTRATIREVYRNLSVLLEPHGAVAWKAWEDNHIKGIKSVILETAHPAKFPKEIKELLNLDPEIPPAIKKVMKKKEAYDTIEAEYKTFKKHLLSHQLT